MFHSIIVLLIHKLDPIEIVIVIQMMISLGGVILVRQSIIR
ncbi:Uncharacterised protein [Mycobacteroides abscessus subsp. abscessus]|nr:Uncharacterised protein [Mycobacteroides abscessus subsp. abscessus]